MSLLRHEESICHAGCHCCCGAQNPQPGGAAGHPQVPASNESPSHSVSQLCRFLLEMETGLNSQDKKGLEKLIKIFALKTVQVIVQAQRGEKICTHSSSSPMSSDWFNLAIKTHQRLHRKQKRPWLCSCLTSGDLCVWRSHSRHLSDIPRS